METVAGEHILLRPIGPEDTADILRWRNAPFVQNNFLWRETLTEEVHLRWMKDQVQTGRAVQFVIVDKRAGQPVGSVYLRDIDNVNKKAEYGIYIGEESARGKGFGTEAARLVLDVAFETLQLHKVFLRVLGNNQAAIRSYEKAGFVREGLFRDDVFLDGCWHDVMFMAAF